MDRRGPRLSRLDSVPRRPHRLMVIIPALALLVILAMTYRYAGARWPGNATERSAVDVSETDAGASQPPSPHHNIGAAPAAGFHKAPATAGD